MSLPDDFMLRIDRDGRPITLEEHGRLWEDRQYRFVLTTRITRPPSAAGDDCDVLTTRIGDLACVITIWDGFDPERFEHGSPHLIFETTVFRPTRDSRRGIKFERSEDLYWIADAKLDQPRHATEAEARAWHHAIAERIQLTER